MSGSDDTSLQRPPMSSSVIPPTIVSLGGGHGLYSTLAAMKRITQEITAVVTVADDGGSSGRMRAELDVIPPGDLRMALAALMPNTDTGRFWAGVLQHRFGGRGALAGHPLGNLLLAGLIDVTGDSIRALTTLTDHFAVTGQVLPMSVIPLEIEADVVGLQSDPRIPQVIRGQVAVATTPGQVRRVRLLPGDPPGCVEAISAIRQADIVTLGPGSWFSSVIPHVLVPEQFAALKETSAFKVLLLNLAPQAGETTGFSAERHLHVLAAHAVGLRFDRVLVDDQSVTAGPEREHLERAAALFGAVVDYADVARPHTHLHDPDKVAVAVRRLYEQSRARV